MSNLDVFKGVLQKITRGLCYVGMLLLIPMMLLTSAEVFSRGLFSLPIPGTVELSSFLLAVFILLGIAYTQQQKGHVRVTILLNKLPQKAAAALDCFTTLLCLFIVSIIVWQGWVVAFEEQAVTDMLRIPDLSFRLLVCVAGITLWLEMFLDLLNSASQLVRS
jgi:TRAP-type C4-dicarboxylate transport system permease small subunit